MPNSSVEKKIELSVVYKPASKGNKEELDQTLKDSLATFINHLESELMHASYTEK